MKTIGILVAMPKELTPFIEKTGEYSTVSEAKYDFITAYYGNYKLVMVACGVGKANSAIAAQLLISKFGAEAVINSGVAGGVGKDINILDVIIADKCVNHDIADFLMEKYTPNRVYFETDAELRKAAASACKRLGISAYTGLIASGDIYVTDTAMKNKIISDYSPLAVDMETVSVAMCCYRNDIPFLSIRSISDNADEESTLDPDELENKAAVRASEIVLEMLKN